MKGFIEWLVIVGVLCALGWGIHDLGKRQGVLECQSAQNKSNGKAQVKANAKTAATLKRANTTGNDQEANRAALDRTFANFEKDASHEAADSVDSCVLPDARLRRWNAANAGRVDTAGEGGPASQPDTAALPATGSAFGGGARLGNQSTTGDQGVSQAGRPDVQPADVSGDQP